MTLRLRSIGLLTFTLAASCTVEDLNLALRTSAGTTESDTGVDSGSGDGSSGQDSSRGEVVTTDTGTDTDSSDSSLDATDGSAAPSCEGDAACADGNSCTISTCENGSCVAEEIIGNCDDGLACTDTDECIFGACVGTNTCTGGQACSLTTGQCFNCTLDDECDDNNRCTADSCSDGVCYNNNNTQPCDDGNECTDDVCSDGSCVGTNNTEPCDDGNECTDDVCAGGSCVGTDNTVPCDDENICTDNDACFEGSCGGWGNCASDSACVRNTGTCALCTAGQIGSDSSCYLYTASQQDSGGEARTTCQGVGLNWEMVQIDSQREQDFLLTLITDETYVGGTDNSTDSSEGNWIHPDGTMFWQGYSNGEEQNDQFTSWRDDQPNNATLCGQDCMMLETDGDWIDVCCNDDYRAVCEGPTAP